MEPKKNLKKHTLVEPKWAWGEHLINRINEISADIHRNAGSANWIFTGSDTADLLDEVLRDYDDTPDIEIGDTRVDGSTYTQDVTIYPRKSVENVMVNFNLIHSGATTMDYIDGDWGDGP